MRNVVAEAGQDSVRVFAGELLAIGRPLAFAPSKSVAIVIVGTEITGKV